MIYIIALRFTLETVDLCKQNLRITLINSTVLRLYVACKNIYNSCIQKFKYFLKIF